MPRPGAPLLEAAIAHATADQPIAIVPAQLADATLAGLTRLAEQARDWLTMNGAKPTRERAAVPQWVTWALDKAAQRTAELMREQARLREIEVRAQLLRPGTAGGRARARQGPRTTDGRFAKGPP